MVEQVQRDIVQHRYQGTASAGGWIPGGDYIDAGARFRVKYKDYFHMKNLYIMMREWLIEEGYVDREDTAFNEEMYLQRESQKAGEELWIWWRFVKVPEQGGRYWAYALDIDMHVILLREVEVMHQGVKYKTNWGEPEIVMTARLIEDYQGTWRKNAFSAELHKIFAKRLFKKELESHRLALYREAYRLQEAIKTYFKLKTYLPEPELQKWWPQQGIGEVE